MGMVDIDDKYKLYYTQTGNINNILKAFFIIINIDETI